MLKRTLAWMMVSVGLGLSQTAAPQFEVASLKPVPPSRGPVSPMQADPGRIIYNTVSPLSLLQIAYGKEQWGISGGPAWLDSDRYDFAATLPKGASQDQVPLMLRTFLGERFHLETRTETRQMTAYSLVVAKGGLKLKAGQDVEEWSGGNMNGAFTDKRITLPRVSMPVLAGMLALRTGRPVVDMTHLPGVFNIDLRWTPDGAADTSGPSIFKALEEQAGLKLESGKAPVEILVVTRMEKPTEN